MSYHVEIIFGKEEIFKYKKGESLTDYQNLINRKKFEFKTLIERNSFYKGLAESNRWLDFEIIRETETIFEDDLKNDTFNYWRFIEKYYPNYDHCDDVLLSDILTRKLNGGKISDEDEEYIKDWDIRKELMELDKKLLGEAFESYFYETYPK